MSYPTGIDKSIAARFVRHRSLDLGYKVRCVLAPLDAKDAAIVTAAKLPPSWSTALSAGTWADAAAALGWDIVAAHLPKTCALLAQRMVGLGVFLPEDEPPTMLYFLATERSDIVAFEGFPPLTLPHSQVPADLAAFREMHDGWFEFYSGELGPLPQEEWEALGPDADDLVIVAIKGSSSAGFTKHGGAAYIVWSEDQKVEAVTSVMSAIDGWVSASFEE